MPADKVTDVFQKVENKRPVIQLLQIAEDRRISQLCVCERSRAASHGSTFLMYKSSNQLPDSNPEFKKEFSFSYNKLKQFFSC